MIAREDILIEVSPAETRAAVVDEAGRLVAFHVERMGRESLVGAICLGQIARVDKGAGGAFLDIGDGGVAYLGRSQGLHEGQKLIVQITRDARDDKGPAITLQPALTGRYLALRPGGQGVSWSRRLGAGRVRAELEKIVMPLMEEDDALAIRANAAAATSDMIAREARRLRDRWRAIAASSRTSSPATLEPAPRLVERLIRDRPATGDIVIDDRRLTSEVAVRVAETMPDLDGRVVFHDGPRPLFEAAGVEDQIDLALARRVPLSGGGSLVVDELETLTAIDVNFGSAGGRSLSEDAILKLNLAAAPEAARQVMLRNIGGVVLIDFVSMRSKQNRRTLVDAVRRGFRNDLVTVDVLGMTSAGLVELTRQRREPSLASILLQPAVVDRPATAETLACEALRALLRRVGAGRPVLRCAPEVAAALQGSLLPAFEETRRRLGQAIDLRVDPTCRGYEALLEVRQR